MKIRHELVVLALLASSIVRADGFDEHYAVYQGDLNADGRIDLYVKQKPQIVILHGPIATPIVIPPDVTDFVLQQNLDKTFTMVTSLTATQKATMAAWPNSSVELVIDDFNIDDVKDIIISGVSGIIPNAFDQIVFADADTPRAPPISAQAMDNNFQKFFTEANEWLFNKNYFWNTAISNEWYDIVEGNTLTAMWSFDYLYFWDYEVYLEDINDAYNQNNIPSLCYDYYCEYDVDGGWLTGEGGWLIYATATEYSLVVDYNNFNQDALNFASVVDSISFNGIIDLIAQSIEAILVNDILEAVLGVEVYGGVLINGGILGVEMGLDGGDLDQTRGEVLGAAISLLAINSAPTLQSDWRPLTEGEKEFATESSIDIKNIDVVKVFNKQYWVFNGQVMSPNGNIFIDQPNVIGLPWSLDYYFNPIIDQSHIIHEMVHLYQHNTLGWSLLRMTSEKAKSQLGQGYCYTITTGKLFSNYNMEQQAQMVQDRFLLWLGQPHWLPCNQSATLQQLEEVIPF